MPSINLGNIDNIFLRKKFWEHHDLNPGSLGVKRKHFPLCYAAHPAAYKSYSMFWRILWVSILSPVSPCRKKILFIFAINAPCEPHWRRLIPLSHPSRANSKAPSFHPIFSPQWKWNLRRTSGKCNNHEMKNAFMQKQNYSSCLLMFIFAIEEFWPFFIAMPKSRLLWTNEIKM